MTKTKKPTAPTCAWFLLCKNPAVGYEPHPILGSVLICARCAAKLAALKPKVDDPLDDFNYVGSRHHY